MAQVAYLIAAHKGPEQLARLLTAVWHADNTYLVHVEARADQACHDVVADFAADHRNVWLLPPIAVLWGAYAFVELQLLAIARLLDLNPNWQHFVLLSGQCLPLRSQPAIAAFLEQRADANFVLVSEQRFEVEPFLRERIDRLFVDDFSEGRPCPLPTQVRRCPPTGIDLRYGSAYGILSRAFCEYLCHSPQLIDLKLFLRHTFAADETLIATALMHSPYRDTWVPDYRRELYFPPGASSPAVMTMADRPRLRDSQALFARKFDLAVDSAVVDAVLERALS